MKNATKHADVVKSLLKKIVKEKAPAPQQVDPLLALVRGVMSYDVPDAAVDQAMQAIDREFVDLNELRVATELEVQEILGLKYPRIEQRVALITSALNAIFEKEHTLSLERLRSLSKKDARQFLRELIEHVFVEAFVMLYALDAPCLPVDETMLAYLKQQGAVSDEADAADAQKFIETQFKGEDMHSAYRALRAEAFAAEQKKK